MLNNSDKINFESNKTSHMITIRFFSNRSNMFFERRIVVNKYESIKDSLQYFIKSIGEVDIQHYSITEVINIANQSRLEFFNEHHRLEHFWGDVMSYIVEFMDESNNYDEILIVGNIDCDASELRKVIYQLNDKFKVINIYEYEDCWIKRIDNSN